MWVRAELAQIDATKVHIHRLIRLIVIFTSEHAQ